MSLFSSQVLDDEVVSVIGGVEITRREMRAYFARVVPPELGAPIDCKIYVAGDHELCAIGRAIVMFTGYTPVITPCPDSASQLGCRYHVTAPASAPRNMLEGDR